MTAGVKPSPWLRHWRFSLMTGLALITAAYALVFMFGMPPGNPIVRRRMMGSYSGRYHVACGFLALVIGPAQLLDDWRRRYPLLHVWAGRIYMVCILFSSVAGFKVSIGALAHPIGNAGFSVLATAWLYTAIRGWTSIRKGNIVAHRDWMLRNFALTYAAPTLRVLLPSMILLGMDGRLALSINGYLCWIPNLIFIESRIKKKRQT
ncbi:Lid2 complex component lid2 [Sphaceloma murrayae]|uniref:Lid2 complex component lid2 n=1 Tax=Sphaceloma murrayae TaxID=2082308 RepID=A0A2K1QM19_9PEZI|nr:Lid2 complex component lid2 [Sphaceloma murrayae]